MRLKSPCIPRRALVNSVAFISLLLTLVAHSQPATLEGTVVKIPVVTVGGAPYAIDLTLIPGSEPITFDLTAAAEVPGADVTGASTFEGTTLNIPAIQIGPDNLQVTMILSNDAPIQFQLSGFTVNAAEETANAASLFESNIASQIVDSRCVTCHVANGVAPAGGSTLVFERPSGTSIEANLAAFSAFASGRSDALEYILTKVSGGNLHGGGPQLAVGSADYNNLQNFLDALINGGVTTTVSTDASFFKGVSELGSTQTLRRAAIIFAGRAPTSAEIAAVENGDENTLRSTIRSLMTGDNFHDFLIEGANDRLLVRGTNDSTFLDGGGIFPNFTNTWIDLSLSSLDKYGTPFDFDTNRFVNGVDRGLRDSPLELIAYVVENDKPYSEILTADYMMTNSVAAFAMNGTGTFPNPEDYSDFQPVTLDKYYAWSQDVVREEVVELQMMKVVTPGSLSHDFPHAGVLNTQSFLFRYPTTATNRNRARSRWTYRYFLDTDIEASAPRTTDPVALADTNNPTMNNSNCTVCHATLDPLAGAFQYYADEGHYLSNGYDSLDNFYKYPEDGKTPYVQGDTWYRDMRKPGLQGEAAPDDYRSLQWAAQKIVQDPRFARAAVKFWWPAVIGAELLAQPEVQTDANYQAKLMAYDAQSAAIQTMTESFVNSGMNLKDLLVEMTLSPWFRASGVTDANLDAVEAEAHSLANLGSERLLTPEQLARKSISLTGFTWRNNYDFVDNRNLSGFTNEYPLYYGGIDSAGVVKRSTDMTALMSTMAMTHASESSCPIVLREFTLLDGTRALFNGIEQDISPLTEGVESFELATTYNRSFVKSTASVTLNSGAKDLYVSINNGFCDWNEAAQTCDSTTRIEVQSLEIQMPNGSVSKITPNQQNSKLAPDCAWYTGDGVGLCNASKVSIPFTPSMAGEYKLTATIWPLKEGEDHPQAQSVSVSIGADADVAPLTSTAMGAQKIRAKLVELHERLHGDNLDPFGPEINLAYQLFVESWDDVRNLPNGVRDYSNINWAPDITCNIWQDYEVGVGMPTDIPPYTTEYNDWGNGPSPQIRLTDEMSQFLGRAGADPLFTKRAWITVITYMLSHYNYLYE